MKNYQQKSVEPKKKKQELNVAAITDYMVMAKKLITFTPDVEIMKAIETLLQNRITGAPVLNSKHEVIGLIDDKDCLRVLFDRFYHNQPIRNNTVSHYMTNVMKTISVHADIIDVADVFLKSKYKRLLVVDDNGKLVGQISRRDILRAIKELNQPRR